MAMLLAIWLLAWGSLSWANVLSGLVVAGGLMVALPDARRPARLPVIRPVALVRLGLRLAKDLVVANLVLIREVLSPWPRISTGVVRVPLPECSDQVLTLLANLVALTPGTIPVEVERDSGGDGGARAAPPLGRGGAPGHLEPAGPGGAGVRQPRGGGGGGP